METTISQTRDDRIRDFRFDLDQLLLELFKSRHPELQRPDGSWPERMTSIENGSPFRAGSPFRGASLLDA